MKKYIIKFLLSSILFIGFVNGAYSQSNVIEAQYKYGNSALNKFLNDRFGEEAKGKNINVCLISVTFAKFTIDTSGNIKSLTFSENKDTPNAFKEILKDVINSTSGLWLPRRINGKAVESKLFVLPLIYEMEAGCYVSKKTVNNGTANSLLNFLDFEDENGNKLNQLDCILLKPLHIFSAN
ncbi:MAG: hypothetical protein JST50_03345 [Bacteroidetes bacterium]|jgi:hypothetical protein|nr:hypothetical protein [Bacteroidota bacterium]